MADTVTEIPPFLWDCVWQSSACLLIAVALSFLYAGRSARAHRALLFGMIACVVLPLLRQTVRHLGWGMFVETAHVEPAVLGSAAGTLSVESPPFAASTAATDGPLASWGAAFALLWLVISGVVLVRLVLSMALAARILVRARPLVDKDMQDTVDGIAVQLGLRAAPTVFASDSVQCPVMWGWRLHPALLVPRESPENAPSLDWRSILCHELAHCRRRDHLAGLFAELMVCMFPWQPLAWWARRRLGHLSELACDDWALESGHAPEEYSESLLAFVPQRRQALAPAAFTSKRSLMARIRRILRGRRTDPQPGRAWTASGILVTACLVLLVACAQTRLVTAPPQEDAGPMLPLMNSGFEIGGDGPACWFEGAAVEGVEYIWDKDVAYQGRASICLKKTAQRYFPIAHWAQAVPHTGEAPYLKLGAWVKAEQAYKAILDVQFTDENDDWRHEWAAYIGVRQQGDPPADHDWKYYSGVVAVPPGTRQIHISLQVYGPGTVWFDDISAEYMDETVAAASIR